MRGATIGRDDGKGVEAGAHANAMADNPAAGHVDNPTYVDGGATAAFEAGSSDSGDDSHAWDLQPNDRIATDCTGLTGEE